jgi:hypothetical protein
MRKLTCVVGLCFAVAAQAQEPPKPKGTLKFEAVLNETFEVTVEGDATKIDEVAVEVQRGRVRIKPLGEFKVTLKVKNVTSVEQEFSAMPILKDQGGKNVKIKARETVTIEVTIPEGQARYAGFPQRK